jgi:hypothetical protein
MTFTTTMINQVTFAGISQTWLEVDSEEAINTIKTFLDQNDQEGEEIVLDAVEINRYEGTRNRAIKLFGQDVWDQVGQDLVIVSPKESALA